MNAAERKPDAKDPFLVTIWVIFLIFLLSSCWYTALVIEAINKDIESKKNWTLVPRTEGTTGVAILNSRIILRAEEENGRLILHLDGQTKFIVVPRKRHSEYWIEYGTEQRVIR